MPKQQATLLALVPVALFTLANIAHAKAVTLNAPVTGESVTVDPATGVYSVSTSRQAWTFSGTLGVPLNGIKVTHGADAVGAYQQVSFQWNGGMPLQGAIKQYSNRPFVQFSVTVPSATQEVPQFLPTFTTVPQGLHDLSYKEEAMSPPTFHLAQNGTPWFLFDDNGNTAVLSSGSDFLVSEMRGDGANLLSVGLSTKLTNLPAGFTHSSWLVVGRGVESTIHAWGDAITDSSGKLRTSDNADLLVKYLGYWTDNGAYYYYNYDPQKGYAGTILAVADYYRAQNIPIHYMQLDSWWYQKTQTSPEGVLGGPKNAKLPKGTWNAYGGTLDYSASPDLFPNGLAAFHKQLGLPLVVHGRWIDPTSPYHNDYKISGVAPVDPRWWTDRANYLRDSGVITYEQDWLNEIYKNSPEMQSTLDTGPAFSDNMSIATKNDAMTMQYCMPLPRFFLQGVNYDNLTTIRTSNDRFNREKWNDFLYTSILADSLRVRPWVDVFKSTELGNLAISDLSSGPVGIGDEMGAESRPNIMLTIREDGVIVKPDAPLLPTDATIIADSAGKHQPLLASTFTNHGLLTQYVFAFARKGDSNAVSFSPNSLGFSGQVYVSKYPDTGGQLLNAGDTYTDTLTGALWELYTVAPVGRSGIAFLGDQGKIIGTGRQRISSVVDGPHHLTASVVLSPSEHSVTLYGYAVSKPTLAVDGTNADTVTYDASTGRFTATITPTSHSATTRTDGDSVTVVKVELRTLS